MLISTVSTVLMLALAPLFIGCVRKFKAWLGTVAAAGYHPIPLARDALAQGNDDKRTCQLGLPRRALCRFERRRSRRHLCADGFCKRLGNRQSFSCFRAPYGRRRALVMGGMDAASAFGGMGSSRE